MDDMALILQNTIASYRDAARFYTEIRDYQSPPPAPSPIPPAPEPEASTGDRLEAMGPQELYKALQADPKGLLAQLALAEQEGG